MTILYKLFWYDVEMEMSWRNFSLLWKCARRHVMLDPCREGILTGYGHASSCELSQGLQKPLVCFSVPWFQSLASDLSWYLSWSQKVPNPILVAITFFFVLHVSRSIDSWCQIVVGQNFLSHPWSITAELFYSGAMCKIVCRFGLTLCRCQ